VFGNRVRNYIGIEVYLGMENIENQRRIEQDKSERIRLGMTIEEYSDYKYKRRIVASNGSRLADLLASQKR